MSNVHSATSSSAPVVAGVVSAAVAHAPFDPTKVKVVKQVSTNLLKLRAGMTVYVRITGKMEVAKDLKRKPTDKESKKEPPTLVPCIDLTTDEVVSIIAGAVLKDLLNDEYPKEVYIGKAFQIRVLEQKDAAGGGGKRYNTYDVKQIEA